MVVKISGYSRKTNVRFRKNLITTPQKPTTQMHTQSSSHNRLSFILHYTKRPPGDRTRWP
jgi:hypothetical protein